MPTKTKTLFPAMTPTACRTVLNQTEHHPNAPGYVYLSSKQVHLALNSMTSPPLRLSAALSAPTPSGGLTLLEYAATDASRLSVLFRNASDRRHRSMLCVLHDGVLCPRVTKWTHRGTHFTIDTVMQTAAEVLKTAAPRGRNESGWQREASDWVDCVQQTARTGLIRWTRAGVVDKVLRYGPTPTYRELFIAVADQIAASGSLVDVPDRLIALRELLGFPVVVHQTFA